MQLQVDPPGTGSDPPLGNVPGSVSPAGNDPGRLPVVSEVFWEVIVTFRLLGSEGLGADGQVSNSLGEALGSVDY